VGTLYLVATPIGNLEDISARAIRILREVSLIAAEDTRQTRKLLDRYEIHTAVTSYHEHSKLSKKKFILSTLESGNVAVVCDAGTPALNDPGYALVKVALEEGHIVSPIPGPSAAIAALVASGLPTDTFLYLGFLPRKPSERRRKIKEISSLPYTLVMLETPHRLLDSLKDLEDILGDRQVAVARELTKLYEEIFRGSLSDAKAYFTENPPRGEFTLVLAGLITQSDRWSDERLQETMVALLDQGLPPSQVASKLAGQSGWQRREIYQMAVKYQHP
jgi:16S rRNA (cytidine1402-2'-O)-methyltransferase